MFAHLSKKPDQGLGQFRAMLQTLITWSHFEPGRRGARYLPSQATSRDTYHKLQKQRKERERKEAAAKAPQTTMPELKAKYIALLQGEVEGAKRGYVLEEVLQSLSKLSDLETTEPFRVNGEQIDGAVKYDGEHYLIEAKWQDKAASNEPVYQFASKIEGKMYGRGIFVSIHGYSDHVVSSLVAGKL
jgi:Restriction endonuclease